MLFSQVNSLNDLWLDFLPSLHLAVNIWTDLVNEVIQSDKKVLGVYVLEIYYNLII